MALRSMDRHRTSPQFPAVHRHRASVAAPSSDTASYRFRIHRDASAEVRAMNRSALLVTLAALASASHASAQHTAQADTAAHHARPATASGNRAAHRPVTVTRRKISRTNAARPSAQTIARPAAAPTPVRPTSTIAKAGCAGSTPTVALNTGSAPAALSGGSAPLLRRPQTDSSPPAPDLTRLAHAGAPPRAAEGAMCRVAPAGGSH
jgi:hypothetical protein